MYIKGLFLFFILLYSTLIVSAQKIVLVNGFVKDSIGNPVVTASVTLITENGAGIAFTKTNEQGFFDCKFQGEIENISIKITALGYLQVIRPVSQISSGPLTLILKKTVHQLKEVVIKSTNKIQLSSDTLKYNVNAFKDRNDRVIADLIGRLPGIQIDEKGIISYNGKSISNVYIDGDNVLDGKYKMVTNNVPIGAVEQIQVIEKDQPIKALNGYVIANNVSLNLKLTDSASTMTFNTGYIGGGNKAYTAELSNLIFQKKVKSINTLKTNNTGYNLERENANVGVSTNADEIGLKVLPPYLSIASETLPSLEEKYYLANNDNTGSVNTLFKLKSDWSLRLNIASLHLKRKYNYNNSLSYFLPNTDTISYSEIQNNIYKLNQWQIQTQMEKNSNSVYLKSVTKLDIPKWNRKGSTTQNEQKLEQSQPDNDLSLSNETSVVKALGVDNVFQYNSIIQYYKKSETLKILPGIQEDIVNDSIAYLSLDQQVKTKKLFVNQSITYKTKFNQFVLSASMGLSFERNKLNSGLYKTDSSKIQTRVGMQFTNNLIFDQLGLLTKLSIIYLIPKGSISIGTSPSYNFIDHCDYFLANPLIEFRNNMGKYSEFSFKYAQQTEFGQINDIYPGTILVNYRQFNFNESPLPKTDINTFNVRYSYRKPLKMVFYNINFSYNSTKQNYINSFTIDKGITKSIAIDFKNKSDNYTVSGGVSKYLFFLSTNISGNGNLSLQKGYNLYNDEISPFESYNMNLSVTARKKIFPTASLSLTGEVGKFINQQKTLHSAIIENTTNICKLKAEWHHQVSNEISYQVFYNLTSYQQSLQQTVNNNFLDVNVKYAPEKWKSHFELQCINLMNRDSYQQITSSPNQLSIFRMPLRERTFILKYSFSF